MSRAERSPGAQYERFGPVPYPRPALGLGLDVTSYRVFFLDSGDHVVCSEDVECPSDPDALMVAAELKGDYESVEVWDGARVVGRMRSVAPTADVGDSCSSIARQVSGRLKSGNDVAQLPFECGVWSGYETSHRRVRPVSTDHEITGEVRSAVERQTWAPVVHLRQNTHAFADSAADAPELDHVAAGAQGGRRFDQGRFMTGAQQPSKPMSCPLFRRR